MNAWSYPIDTFAKNPIVTFKEIKTTYTKVEVKAHTKRDRILLSIPEWINTILTYLLIYQLFKILQIASKVENLMAFALPVSVRSPSHVGRSRNVPQAGGSSR